EGWLACGRFRRVRPASAERRRLPRLPLLLQTVGRLVPADFARRLPVPIPRASRPGLICLLSGLEACADSAGTIRPPAPGRFEIVPRLPGDSAPGQAVAR